MKEESLHREILEEHARNPRFVNQLEDFTHQAFFRSSKTGNTCQVKVKLDGGIISAASLHLEGSALANAGASLLYSEIISQNVDQIKDLIVQLINFLEQDTDRELPGDLCVYASIKRFPERYDCALLAWRALAKALSD